nr:fibroblast growth factor receptor substrate 3 [Ciona intestinalis]|eukprot:XP_002121024.1 fibroblast growth factor receptor substrate 3 [Ciona intestinalis]
MGCSQSLPNDAPRMFKARNLNDKDKAVNAVTLEVSNKKVIVRSRNRKIMASWPIACLRRYGCNLDSIFIEAGNGCETGQGMYLFKCSHTDELFELLRHQVSELQAEQERLMPAPHHMQFTSLPQQSIISTNGYPRYMNVNNSSGSRHVTSNGNANYANGSVRNHQSAIPTPPPGYSAPVTPAPRGSTSSQHTATLASLPEDETLTLNHQPFALQPAPTSRQEMISRRRVNSEMVATYDRGSDRVKIVQQRRNSENANYENNDVMEHSGSFPRRVRYEARSEEVTIDQSAPATSSNDDKPSPSAVESVSRDVSMMSLRSDCEPLLTPGSNSTSGIGSLNGNGSTISQNPPPIPPHPTTTAGDPWRRHNFKVKPHNHHFHRRLSPTVPHSAQPYRDYVNTTHASMDISGTPLPATAVGSMHFNFDFDSHLFGHRPRSGSSKLNYVPVEAFKNGDDFSCGASSASSGIPGTPRTPKTPKTPLSSHPAIDYAIIDPNKTRALSNTHRTRQRERKSRHES